MRTEGRFWNLGANLKVKALQGCTGDREMKQGSLALGESSCAFALPSQARVGWGQQVLLGALGEPVVPDTPRGRQVCGGPQQGVQVTQGLPFPGEGPGGVGQSSPRA